MPRIPEEEAVYVDGEKLDARRKVWNLDGTYEKKRSWAALERCFVAALGNPEGTTLIIDAMRNGGPVRMEHLDLVAGILGCQPHELLASSAKHAAAAPVSEPDEVGTAPITESAGLSDLRRPDPLCAHEDSAARSLPNPVSRAVRPVFDARRHLVSLWRTADRQGFLSPGLLLSARYILTFEARPRGGRGVDHRCGHPSLGGGPRPLTAS